MPIEAQPKLYLPMFTVLSALFQACCALGNHVGLGDRVVVERELRDVVLARADVLDEVIVLVLRVRAEEHVVI